MKEKRNKKQNHDNKASESVKKIFLPLAVCAIVISLSLFYSNSLTGAFIFDDLPTIVDNPTIRNLWNLQDIFSAPFGSGLANRPFINASFALNYAISGHATWSYHLLNLFIHIAAALTLLGIVRRTLVQENIPEDIRNLANLLALTCCLVWALHPLLTGAVSYITQRCESLMGLCFFLTLYCAIRGWQASRKMPWHLAAVFFYFLGIGSKEVIIAAPAVVIIYEFIFIHKSIKEIWRKSAWLHGGLAAGTAVLLYPMFFTDFIAVSLGNKPVSLLTHWATQPEVVLHYIRLAFWPHPLSFDYGWPLANPFTAWPYFVIISILIVAALWLLYKRHPLALPATSFFLILAPTSIFPVIHPAVEYRMYLPLAALTTIVIPCLFASILKLFQASSDRFLAKRLFCIAMLVFIIALGLSTYSRNKIFVDGFVLWENTVKTSPGNGRAHLNLGAELDRLGRIEEAAAQFDEAIRLKDDNGSAHASLCYALYRMGKTQEAIGYCQEALTMNPRNVAAYSNLGIALWESGQTDAARKAFETALQLNPNQPEVLSNLGNMLNSEGRYNDALVRLRGAIRLRPEFAEAHANLGFALEQTGNSDDAMREYAEALRINPSLKEVQNRMEGLARRLALARKNK
jgi:tetratricopeptide (TPR) repeat protein